MISPTVTVKREEKKRKGMKTEIRGNIKKFTLSLCHIDSSMSV